MYIPRFRLKMLPMHLAKYFSENTPSTALLRNIPRFRQYFSRNTPSTALLRWSKYWWDGFPPVINQYTFPYCVRISIFHVMQRFVLLRFGISVRFPYQHLDYLKTGLRETIDFHGNGDIGDQHWSSLNNLAASLSFISDEGIDVLHPVGMKAYIKYTSVPIDVNSFREALKFGPLVVGMQIDKAFDSYRGQHLYVDDVKCVDGRISGYHAVIIFGEADFSDGLSAFALRNSNGEKWGIGGTGFIIANGKYFNYIFCAYLIHDVALLDEISVRNFSNRDREFTPKELSYLNMQFYKKALEMFEDDQPNSVILHRHLMRTNATSIVDTFLWDLVVHIKLKCGMEVDQKEFVPLSPGERLTLAKSLPGSLSTKVVELVEALEGKILVIFCGADEINVAAMCNILGQIANRESLQAVMLILQNKLSSYVRKEMANYPVKIDMFQITELLVNIMKHVLMPKHEMLSDAEKQKTMTNYQV